MMSLDPEEYHLATIDLRSRLRDHSGWTNRGWGGGGGTREAISISMKTCDWIFYLFQFFSLGNLLESFFHLSSVIYYTASSVFFPKDTDTFPSRSTIFLSISRASCHHASVTIANEWNPQSLTPTVASKAQRKRNDSGYASGTSSK